LIALIDPGNVASVRTAEGAGLRFERDIDVDGKKAQLYAIHRAMAGRDEPRSVAWMVRRLS
jgi:hypothetical protein